MDTFLAFKVYAETEEEEIKERIQDREEGTNTIILGGKNKK